VDGHHGEEDERGTRDKVQSAAKRFVVGGPTAATMPRERERERESHCIQVYASAALVDCGSRVRARTRQCPTVASTGVTPERTRIKSLEVLWNAAQL